MRLKIRHETRYHFDSPVTYALQQLRKTPRNINGQQVLSWSTTIEGGAKELIFEDHHRNIVELISFGSDTHEMIITSEGEVEREDIHGITGKQSAPAPMWYFLKPTTLTRSGPGIRAFVKQFKGMEGLEAMHALSVAVRDAVVYEKKVSLMEWDAEAVLAEGRGVCQDHAHVFIAAAREMGYPARYISGYLSLDGMEDQEAMHAWVEAFVGDLGWVGFDVSNVISPDKRYVTVAVGNDYSEAAPVRGMQMGGEGETLTVDISVTQQ